VDQETVLRFLTATGMSFADSPASEPVVAVGSRLWLMSHQNHLAARDILSPVLRETLRRGPAIRALSS
jgi:hypothetical protein